ncbi:MAG TPA: glycoside hydrolase domain-containing protein [Anaeromyxobacter sp.]
MSTRRAPLLAALALAPLAARAADVWVAGATEKIRPDAQARQATQASLEAARNEFEAFQIVVTGRATQVSVEASALGSPEGVIPDVRLYREDLIDLAQASSLDGAAGRWPDALVPDVDDVVGEKRNAFPFDVGEGESRAVWVEYHVPADARSAVYRGGVKVKTAEGETVVPVKLAVWDFTLPSTASLKTHFGLESGDLPAGHGGVSGDDASALRARYAQLGLDHRVSLSAADDVASSDLDRFDRFYRPLVDGNAPTRLAGARLTSVKYPGDRGSVDDQRAWAQRARAGGWMDRLFQYTCDEPPLTCGWGDIAAMSAAAHQADPAFRTLVTTTIQDADANGVTADIDVLVPVVNYVDDKGGDASRPAGDQRAAYDGFLSAPGKELWLYQSCMSHGCVGAGDGGSPETAAYATGWPSYVIDASAVRNRAMEWLSFLEGASGELYWDTAFAFSHDAWSNQLDFSGNGDGTLFYPGTPSRIGGATDIPVASIRLKMIREGMEDYEYLKLLSDAGDPQMARRVARALFPSASATDVDPAKLMATREAIAARILELTGKDAPRDGVAGGCTGGGGTGGLALLAVPGLLALAAARRRRAAR